MTAMVLRTDRSISLERRPVPIPRDDQVLVDIDLCGICPRRNFLAGLQRRQTQLPDAPK